MSDELKRVIAYLRKRAADQEHFAGEIYTQFDEKARECFRHAAHQFRWAALDLEANGLPPPQE